MRIDRFILLAICLVLLESTSCSRDHSPAFELPEPTGDYAVGTITLYFVDTSRPEIFTPDPDDHREVAVNVWYPADPPVESIPVAYMEHADERKRVLSKYSLLPPSFYDKLAQVKTHSYRDAPIAKDGKRYPLVLFSHAYWAGMNQSTVLMEELASNGYVVASIGHAYETSHVVKPDGQVIAFDPRNEEFLLRARERENAQSIQHRIGQTTDSKELEDLFRTLRSLRPKTMESLRMWVEDISFIIHELERMNGDEGFFTGRLDSENIGVIGHSFGGTAAGQACLTDARCKAGINLDGLQLGDLIDRNLSRPFMFMHHDNVEAINSTPNYILFERAEETAYMLLIKGSGHLNFSDLSLPGLPDLLNIPEGAIGTIDGLRCLKIQNDYILAFFNKHLKEKDSGLLDGPSSDYPEVILEVINRKFSDRH
jgi:predicted dienelactone hydrolase